ncbi:PTPRQ phosphatase, partial [Amia calva]|nr:PTPRQ phosphatase [Amia calva]
MQMNATGSNYFFTGFFCYIPLPYLCQYKFPSLPLHFEFELEDVKEKEAWFSWSDLENWLKPKDTAEMYIEYQTEGSRDKLHAGFPLNVTRLVISRLSPGHVYLFAFKVKHPGGALLTLGPVLKVQTRPNPPQNITVKKVTAKEIPLYWTAPDNSQNATFDHYLISCLDIVTKTLNTLVVENYKTSSVVSNLRPYHPYSITVRTVTVLGSASCVDSPLSVITGIPPSSVYVNPEDVGVRNVTVHWESAQEEEIDEYYILVRSVTVGGDVKNYWVNSSNSFEISMLTPGMTYEIGVAAVKHGNMSEMKTVLQTLKPERVQIVVPYELNTHSVVLYVQKPHAGVFDGISVTYRGGSNRKSLLKGEDKITIENLTPGTEYEFSVYATSGSMASAAYQVPTVKTCLAPPTNVREGNVSETSVEIVWSEAEGSHQNYEVICIDCGSMFMVQKVKEGRGVFTHLVPGKMYNFSIRTEKENFKDSTQVFQTIRTAPSPVKQLQFNKTSDSITVSWPDTQHVFDGFILSISNRSFNKENKLHLDQRIFNCGDLTPGSTYVIDIRTTSGNKKSLPTDISVTTFPEPPINVKFIEQDENSMFVSWSYPRGYCEAYKLSYGLSTSKEILYKTVLRNNSIKIKDLTPGTEYWFKIQSLQGSDTSMAFTRNVMARPAGICSLSLTYVNKSTVEITPSAWEHLQHYSGESQGRDLWDGCVRDCGHRWGNINMLFFKWICNQKVLQFVSAVVSTINSILNDPRFGHRIIFIYIYFFLIYLSVYLHAKYQVDLTPEEGIVTIFNLGSGESQASITSAKPGQTYTVNISAVSSSVFSSPVSKIVATIETIPSAPFNLEGERVGSTGILLSWTVPLHPNGKILSYAIKYKEVCPWPDSDFTQVLTISDIPEFLLNTLTPGSTYNIKVAAENNAGIGLFSNSLYFKTAESPPGLVTNITAFAYNHSTVKVNWFLPKRTNGLIIKFSIKVKHARNGQTVRSWEVNAEDIMKGSLPHCNDAAEILSRSTPSPSVSSLLTSASSPSTMLSAIPSSSSWVKPISVVVDQLKSYTAYVFEVSAFTSDGEGQIASYMVRMPESAPEDPPQNLSVWNITSKSFSVTWDPPTIVTGRFTYVIELYGPSGYIFENNTSDFKLMYFGLTPYTTYTVSVRAKSAGALGPNANSTVLTPAEAPSAVIELKATVLDSTSVKLSWKSPHHPNGIITQYKIVVSTKTEIVQTITLPSTVSLVTQAPLTSAPPHTSSPMGTSSSAVSNTAYSLPLTASASALPPGGNRASRQARFTLTSSSGPSSVETLTLAEGTMGVSALQNNKAINIEVPDISADQLSYVVKNLIPFTEYTFSVSASTDVGEGPAAGVAEKTREQVPSSVENVYYQNISSTSILVSWDPPSNPNGRITHFTVYGMDLRTKEAFQKVTNETSIILSGLKKYTEYKLRVAASTVVGESSLSEEDDIFVITLEDEPESPPVNLTVQDVTASTATISWSPPAQPNGIILYYKILYENSSTWSTMNSSKPHIQLTNLKPFSSYNVTVRAYTKYGYGNQTSPALNVLTEEDAPGSPPFNLTYESISSTEITVSWLSPLHANGIILSYIVQYWNASHSMNISSTSTKVTISNLKKYSQYWLYVAANTKFGSGNQTSDVLNVTTLEDVPSSSLQFFTARQLSDSEVLLSWKPPLHANGEVLYYTVYVWSQNTETVVNVSRTSVVLRLDSGNEYNASVSAWTRLGNKIMRYETTFRMYAGVPSHPPQNISYVNITSSSIKLFWKPPSTPDGIIQHYTIYYSNSSSVYTQVVTVSKSETDATNSSYSTIIDGLAIFSQYNLWMSASTALGDGNMTSDIIYVYTEEDVPGGPVHLIAHNVSSTAISVSWLPPDLPNGRVFYNVSLREAQTNIPVSEFTTSETTILIQNLQKYTDYILRVTAATAAGFSENSTTTLYLRTDEDLPGSPPLIVSTRNLTSSSIELSWLPPTQSNGIILNYSVLVKGPTKSKISFVSNTSLILSDLKPFASYNLSISAVNRRGMGPAAVLLLYTEEAEPTSPPQDLRMFNHTADTVWLTWSPSPEPNGVVQFYSFRIFENSSQTLSYQNSSGLITELQLTGFKPHSVYQISVSAFTRVGNGDLFSNTVIFTTNESVSDIVQNLNCTGLSWKSVYIQWDPPATPNGIISEYFVWFGNETRKFKPSDRKNTIGGLLANTTYSFHVIAVNSAGRGTEQTCLATTFPESVPSAPIHLNITKIQSMSVTLWWTRPDNVPGYLQDYQIVVQLLSVECDDWVASDCIETEVVEYTNDTNSIVEATVYSLLKYRQYRFSVAARTNAGYGIATEWIFAKTLPGNPDAPPQNVFVIPTSDSIKITWEAPEVVTGPTFYLIDVTSVKNDIFNWTLVRRNEEIKSVVVSNLTAFTSYSVIVTAFTGDVKEARLYGKAANPVYVRTLEDEPKDPPQNVTFQKIPDMVTRVYVTFSPPVEPNGNITAYRAEVYREGNLDFEIESLSVTENKNQTLTAVIDGLKGGNTYSIRIAAVNGAGSGPSTEVQITMEIKAPPVPSRRPVPAFDRSGAVMVTSRTITIKMPVCFFSDDNGPIDKIQVIVAEAEVLESENLTNWKDAFYNKPRPYFTDEGFRNSLCPEDMRRRVTPLDTYVIGAEEDCMSQEKDNKLCNGPLKPKRQYVFKFRGTNSKGQYTDSLYSDRVKTSVDRLLDRDEEIIIGVILSVLLAVFLIVTIYTFARIRQKQKEGGTYSPRDAEIIDTKFKLDQLIAVADLELKEEKLTRLLSYRKSLKPVNKKSFLQHVEDLCSNDNTKFQEEFSELPKLLQDLATSDADLPWNRSKNRFTNIKPYNNNRVKLMSEAGVPGSDYINASYVSGYLCPNEFIATQGPLPGTVADFWRMIWETRTRTIAMLTQCFEKGRIRCHQYWPEDNKPVTVFGDIVITKLAEDVHPDWTIRVLKVERHGDYMVVNHFNFTSWPEHGVPESSTALIQFVKFIRANRAHDNTTIVVHCSAGVGRTGVFIALDHLIQHVRDHDFVDIYGLVAELRSERMCMVQNLAQYMFLHQSTLDLLSSKGNSQSVWFVNYSSLEKMDSLDAMEGNHVFFLQYRVHYYLITVHAQISVQIPH